MELIVVLLIGAPIVLAIWLIARSIHSKSQLEELTRRVDDLQSQIIQLKHRVSGAPEPTDETAQTFKPAVLPPRKTNAEPVPVIAHENTEILTPLAEPSSPTLGTNIEAPPFLVPPPIIPALPPTTHPEPELAKKQALENAKIAEPEAKIDPTSPDFTEKAEFAPPPELPSGVEKSSFEMRLGTYWLVRIGIVMLLTGLAFFANFAYHNVVPKLGPGGKISLLYLASGLLLGAGAWWQRRNFKESLKNYAQVLFAGGLAAVYFSTYAAHHIPPLRVIESAMLDGTLLLAWAGVIMWIADRRKSEVMALFAVGLAFYSSVITRVGDFTLYSNLVLTIAAVGFLIRNRWVSLSFAGLATSYAGYAFWRFLHEEGWRLAAPDERLGFGASFLAAYWLVFTAATFLSKSEKLSGKNRAAFLTLNNGVFFALFLLSMLQTQSGGFWKFSLCYGVALLVLGGLAKSMLPVEPLARNGYLTQGLLLVTLGFITKFAGLQLALVLGVESVVLFLLSLQRQSIILKVFAYGAALLATGWCVTSLHPFAIRGVWTGLALGALMGVNALRAHWHEIQKDPPSQRLETMEFTLLAFISWTATTWFNSAEPHLPVALVLGAESVVMFNLVARRQSLMPNLFAGLTAILGIVWCAINLKQYDTAGLWIGACLGVLMIFNAYRAHQYEGENTAQPLRTKPTIFILLAFASWLATTWFHTTADHLPIALAVEAVVLTFSIYLLRVREITLLGQFFLVLAEFAWLFHFLNATPPWWNPLILIIITIGLSHWWQKQATLVINEKFTFTCQAIFALAAVGLVFVWLHPLVEAPTWLALTSLLAVAATIYGVATRAWPLAICGQIFLFFSVWDFSTKLFHGKPEWYFPLAPLAGLGILSFGTIIWFARKPDSKAMVREPLLQIALVYRWLALAMSLLWIWQYAPEPQRVWAFMVIAMVLFTLAVWRCNREGLVAVAVYAMAAVTTLWMHDGLSMDIYWPNLLSLLALLGMQQILRMCTARFSLDESVHGAIIFGAGISLWRFLSCWVTSNGIFLTMSWVGLAVLVFAVGIVLHERFHRWLGLSVLAAAIGRVVLVDVWKQETIYRVLTFMALGVALLVVGFIYNKYQDAIRKWL